MAATRGQEEAAEKNKKEKMVGKKKRTPAILKRNKVGNKMAKGAAKRKKTLPMVKHSFIAQMASIENKVVGEYVQQGMKKKKYNAHIKQKKEKKLQEKEEDTKMSPEVKKIHDNNTKDNATSEVHKVVLDEEFHDNVIGGDNTKEDDKEKDEQKNNEEKIPTDAAMYLIQFSQKGLQEKKKPSKCAIHQKNAEQQQKRRDGH